jgi:hypothetical protein
LPCPVDPLPLRLPADSLTPGANLAHDTRCPAVGNLARVRPELDNKQLRSELADPGDLIQPVDRLGEAGDQLGKFGVQLGQVGVQGVHPGQHLGEQEGVLVGEEPTERLRQRAEFGAQPGRASCASRFGSRSPASSAAGMARPETPKMSLATMLSLIWASTRQLLDPLGLGGPGRHQVGSVAGQVPQLPDRSWGTKLGRSICRSASLHSQTASSVSVLGRPGRCLTSRALTSQGSNPWASSRE